MNVFSVHMAVTPPDNCGMAVSHYPMEGTTAGGTWVDLYGPSGIFPSGVTAKFEMGGACGGTNLRDGELNYINTQHIKIKTPQSSVENVPSSATALVVKNASDVQVYCGPFAFKTLAYTANQVAQGLSAVNTTENAPFAQKPALPFSEPIVPMGMDYVRPGRQVMVVDLRGGQVHLYDAANFSPLQTLAVQNDFDIPWIWGNIGAVDVAADPNGYYAYVVHMTYGGPRMYHAEPVNYIGSVSILKFGDDGRSPACPEGVYPCVLDKDGDGNTTSNGAPDGITRIEPPADWMFMPLSGRDVYVPRPTEADYQVGDRYPGEYLFLSGFGPAEWGWVPPNHCRPGEHCERVRIILPRPVQTAIVDLNPEIVSAVTLEKGYTVLTKIPNPHFRTFVSRVDIGSHGGFQSDQGLGFSPVSTYGEIHVYAVNPNQDLAAELLFHPDRLPNPIVAPQPGDPLEINGDLISTGVMPSDVKVQKVPDIANPGQYLTRAFITNAGDDTVTVVDTATNTATPESPMVQDLCSNLEHYPISIDSRSKGDRAYSADFNAGIVTSFDLPISSVTQAPMPCTIDVGEAPIRIVVQPVPGYPVFFGIVSNALAFAQPTDFTTPSKQSILLKDWEDVSQLQETNANPQAVLSNINAFQTKANNWITDVTLKNNVNEGVSLYRSAYIYNHPTLRP